MKLYDKADWLAIIMHFIVGSIVGGATFSLAILKLGGVYRYSGEAVIGMTLCLSIASGAGYALLQNEAWVGENYRVIPPIPAQHSLSSLTVLTSLLVLSFLGLALFLYRF